MASNPERTSRPRGRPPGHRPAQRSRLLDAASRLLASRAPQDLTLRHVAQSAGVTPALAHYYFGDRDGLVETLLSERVAPALTELATAALARAEHPLQALTFLMQKTSALLASDPLARQCMWLPLPAATKLRGQLRNALHQLLVDAQERRVLRTDLAPEYLATSLLALALFPFLDTPAGAALPARQVSQLTLQHVALLRDGILHTG